VDLAAKLQLKPEQRLESAGAPPSLEQPEAALVVFVADRSELDNSRAQIVESAQRDRLTWVAYPKSGQLGTDLNRDSLAALLMESGIHPVRQVAIDGVWSALRFRPD
jgi:hypothetical protein